MTKKELLKIIEEAAFSKKTSLHLYQMEINELPVEVGQLSNLQVLELGDNQLRSLPESFGQLTNLKELLLDGNQLTTLPESFGELTNLKELSLDGNQLTALPESFGELTNLHTLFVSDNQLRILPEFFGGLANLNTLYLRDNQLTTLPESFGKLTNLHTLVVSDNQLGALPISFADLPSLGRLSLENNPLNPALQSAYEAGLGQFHAYLQSLEAESEPLYEAKLVFVGEGDVGKTTLLKALTGKGPRKDEPTTHGINIDMSLHLPHPQKKDVEIRLNAWDFGGQEVYRVTHQFFFSRRSIYLLVWEPRAGVQQCQVEDWLRLIRLRVGDDARVIIVSTHCKTGLRIARIDKPVFERDFGDMIVGFHEVDSLEKDKTGDYFGVAELKSLIADAAKDLEHMGMKFNSHWKEARDEILKMGKPRIAYQDFTKVCNSHGLKPIDANTLARLMHDLGYIVYYGEDERLQDDIVLQPEWLTKAIGFVLEDRKIQQMDGILEDERLKEVWLDHKLKNEPKYKPDLYPFFLRLMEKYDVSYRPKEGNTSLIAQHVPQVRPNLPWLPDEEPDKGNRRIAMVCVMDESPPGLVPWMIVRTQDFAYEQKNKGRVHRLHWQKGMFLRNKSHGEALLELRDREFHIYAEAVWPEFFLNVLKQTLNKLITDNWPGMEERYYFAVPCQEKQNGRACEGRFDIEALRQFLKEGDDTIRCQSCRKRQNIVGLLFGFEQEDSREQLNRIETKMVSGFEAVKKEFAGLESRMANYVMAIMQAMANEARDGPRLFTIEPIDGKWELVSKKFRLHLWCEAEDCQHPVQDVAQDGETGVYEFKATSAWVKKVAPAANFIFGVLKTVAPIALPAANLFFGGTKIDELGIKNHLELVKEGSSSLLKDIKISDPDRLHEGMISEAERSGILALHSFLKEQDPNHEHLGLKRLPTYTGDYLWLCEKHYEQMQPKIPDKIE